MKHFSLRNALQPCDLRRTFLDYFLTIVRQSPPLSSAIKLNTGAASSQKRGVHDFHPIVFCAAACRYCRSRDSGGRQFRGHRIRFALAKSRTTHDSHYRHWLRLLLRRKRDTDLRHRDSRPRDCRQLRQFQLGCDRSQIRAARLPCCAGHGKDQRPHRLHEVPGPDRLDFVQGLADAPRLQRAGKHR